MKFLQQIIIGLLFIAHSTAFGQTDSTQSTPKNGYIGKLTVEPGIGINPYPLSDMLVSTLVQWDLYKRLSVVSHTSYTYNNAFVRDFNYIETNYNYSLSQKFGVGTTLYSKNASQTFSLLAGVKTDNFKETLNNPEFETVSVSIHTWSPDFGLMYNLKVGKQKYFFSFRMYLPIYPYPLKSSDIQSIDGNLENLSLEFGVGIRLN